ncbi:MAG TPA: hypothetical protein VH741_09585, partial [Candidatus Limnocylindrales bacterium]
AMGWLLASRLPRNVLGWIFLLIGLGMVAQMAVTFTVQQGHQIFRPLSPLVLAAAWLVSSLHLPSLIVSYVAIFLLFPDGRALSRRWAAFGWATALGVLLVVVGIGLSPAGLVWYPSLANPFAAPFAYEPLLVGVALAGLALLVVGVVVASVSMVVRYRRAGDVERAQLRWVAAAVVLLAGCGVPFVIARYALQMRYAEGELLMLVALGAGAFLPVAAAFAVLRRRLYDIDLILNRALVYIPLTGILGGLYAAGVALFQRVFVALTGNTSDVAIVITTLFLAGLFTPIRNHLQAFVDRRFKPPAAAGAAHEHPELPPLIPADELRAQLAELDARLDQLEARRNM